MAATLLDPGGDHLTAFVDDQQDQGFTFQPPGNGFGRIELAGSIEFLQLLTDGLGPGLGRGGRRLGLPVCAGRFGFLRRLRQLQVWSRGWQGRR